LRQTTIGYIFGLIRFLVKNMTCSGSRPSCERFYTVSLGRLKLHVDISNLIQSKAVAAKMQNCNSTTLFAILVSCLTNISLSLTKYPLGLFPTPNPSVLIFVKVGLPCIRPYLDLKPASTIPTSIAHSILDYLRNSLYYNLPNSHLTRLRQTQNSLARAIVNVWKFSRTTAILQSLHC